MRTILLLLLLGVTPAASMAAAPAALTTASVVSAVQELTPGEIELASQTIEQRNNRAYWHVFMAFAAAFLLLLLYAVTIGRRFGKLEQDISRMRKS